MGRENKRKWEIEMGMEIAGKGNKEKWRIEIEREDEGIMVDGNGKRIEGREDEGNGR